MSSLSTFVCSCNDSVLLVPLSPPAEAQASISKAVALYLILHLSYLVVFPFNKPRLDLGCLLGLEIGAGRREKYEDVVGLIRWFLQSAEGTTADFGA